MKTKVMKDLSKKVNIFCIGKHQIPMNHIHINDVFVADERSIEQIRHERISQIVDHNTSIYNDVLHNPNGELVDAAVALLRNKTGFFPTSWGVAACRKMINKSHKERLIIAGALIAAEIDRLEYLEAQQKVKSLQGF